MKKADQQHTSSTDDMAVEYHFDYTETQPNRFAARFPEGARVIVLDPDVARIFTSQESVNAVLRALIATMPDANNKGEAA